MPANQPPSPLPAAEPALSRRALLKGLGIGTAGVFAAPLLAACTGGSKPSSGGSGSAGGVWAVSPLGSARR